MAFLDNYRQQVALLIRVLPFVAEERVFALKGGTAINLSGILGMSVQYRKPDAEKQAEEQNGVLGAMGVGTAEDLQ